MTRPKVDPDKRQRTARACDSCKRRKQKCNGIKPCMTCEKRNLTCNYVTADEISDEHPSPKRRMIGTVPENHDHELKTRESPVATSLKQKNAWTPGADGLLSSENGFSNEVYKRNGFQSLPALAKGENAAERNIEDRKHSAPRDTDATIDSQASTASQADEEAVVYSNTRMLQDPTGRLLYIGDSATLSFLQLIRMIVDNVAGPSAFTMDPRRHRIVENSLSLPPNLRRTHLLPDRETADVLVNSYFANVNGLIEVFYRKAFLTTLEMCYSDPLIVDPSWLCLLYLTFAIGLVMAAPLPGSREDAIIQKLRAETVDRAEIFYSDAKNLGDPSAGFEDAGFWSIQALTLMSVYMLAVSKRNAAYAYHGMAVRSAFALGLHREETLPIYSSSEQSVRRNLWRTLFILDRFLAASLGRPTSIRESDCSGTTLSSGEQIFPRNRLSTPANTNFTSTHAQGLEAAVQSCHVIGVILENVYSSRKISTKVAQEIADLCKGWHKSLDPSLNYRLQGTASPAQGIAILHTNLLYCHSVVLLTRPFFLFLMNKTHQERGQQRKKTERKALSRLERFAGACVSASLQTIALVQGALDYHHLPHRNPFVLYFLFASALVVIANEFSALFPNPTATQSISKAISIMQYFSQQDTQGSRLLFILTSFRDVAVREQATRPQQSVSQPQSPPVYQQPSHPPSMNDNDPIANMFNLSSSRTYETLATPSSLDPILNRPNSNPSRTPPVSHMSTLRRISSYPSNSQPDPSLRDNPIYSLDNFFDFDRTAPVPHSTANSTANSETNDSNTENAEIDFETLWQWPGSSGMELTPGAHVCMGISGNGILGTSVVGGADVQRISDSNVPLFGMTSADFGAP